MELIVDPLPPAAKRRCRRRCRGRSCSCCERKNPPSALISGGAGSSATAGQRRAGAQHCAHEDIALGGAAARSGVGRMVGGIRRSGGVSGPRRRPMAPQTARLRSSRSSRSCPRRRHSTPPPPRRLCPADGLRHWRRAGAATSIADNEAATLPLPAACGAAGGRADAAGAAGRGGRRGGAR